MPRVKFDWDPDKAAANQRRRGVSFDEAKEVFFDPNAVDRFDPDHSKASKQARKDYGQSSQK
jgi:hypothetical protein